MVNLEDSVRQFCAGAGLALNTDLGQHFLIDQNVLDAIIDAANIEDNEHVVEIGPGIGVLTQELCAKTDNVTVIEIDERLIPMLHTYVGLRMGELPKLSVIKGNALHADFPEAEYKIVANIPYHITSPLFRHVFLESPRPPKSMTLLIQKEVAQRICSQTDSGMLSVIVRLFGSPKYVCNVPPSSFLPPPAVDSAVIHIDCFDKPLVQGKLLDGVFKLAKIGFAQKRKKIRNSIGSLPNGSELLQKANIDANRRPQELQTVEWIALAKEFESGS